MRNGVLELEANELEGKTLVQGVESSSSRVLFADINPTCCSRHFAQQTETHFSVNYIRF